MLLEVLEVALEVLEVALEVPGVLGPKIHVIKRSWYTPASIKGDAFKRLVLALLTSV